MQPADKQTSGTDIFQRSNTVKEKTATLQPGNDIRQETLCQSSLEKWDFLKKTKSLYLFIPE